MESQKSVSRSLQTEDTLIIHLCDSSVSVSVLHSKTDKVLSLFTDAPGTRRTGRHSVPFSVALNHNGLFIYGELALVSQNQVRYVEDVGWQKIGYWELDNILADGTLPDGHSRTVAKCNEAELCQVTVELLLMLYFKYLLTLVENTGWKELLKENITVGKKIIVCLPLWYSHWARRKIEEAFEMLGKKVYVLNEGTTVAYIHHYHSAPVPLSAEDVLGKDGKPLLCFSINTGNVDVALYLAAGDRMKMMACTGNLYLHPEVVEEHENLDFTLMGQEFKRRYNLNRSSRPLRQSLIRGLLLELLQRLPDNAKGCVMRQTLCLLVVGAHIQDWEGIIYTEVNNYFGIQSEPSSATGNCWWVFSHPDIPYGRIFRNLCARTVEDLNPYDLTSCEKMNEDGTMEWCLPGWVMNGNNRNLCVKYPTQKFAIFEVNAAGRKHAIGTITLPVVTLFTYSRVQIQLKWKTLRGIYKLNAVFAINQDGKRVKFLTSPEEYQWETPMLSKQKKDYLQGICARASAYSINYRDSVMTLLKRKDELNELYERAQQKNEVNSQNQEYKELWDSAQSKMAAIHQLVSKETMHLKLEGIDELMKELDELDDQFMLLLDERTFSP